MHFLLSALSIVLIDVLLAGDNALVIALVVRSLAPRERRIGIAGGAAAAVGLRVGLTFVAAQLLEIQYLQIVGGLFILWIAMKVVADASAPPDDTPAPKRFWPAIWYIMVADVTMSVDNILAIAGASKGDFWLILFGLAVSIPFIVLSSNLLSRLMDRWPALILIGSGILGKVAGEMIMTDPVVRRTLAPGDTVRWIIEGGLTAAVIVFGWRRTKDGEHRIPTSMRPGPSSKASRVPGRRKS
jgi:YjbE family integral membrane protein